MMLKQSQKKSQKPSVHKTHDLIKNCDIYVIIKEEKLLRYWMENDGTAMSEMKVHYVQESALYYFIIIFFSVCIQSKERKTSKHQHYARVK